MRDSSTNREPSCFIVEKSMTYPPRSYLFIFSKPRRTPSDEGSWLLRTASMINLAAM